MKTPVILIVLGCILIVFPEIIAYVLGGLFIFFGIIIFSFKNSLSGKHKTSMKDYVKFGDYKIFRGKK